MIITPFGKILIICDGKEITYTAYNHKFENKHFSTPIKECYRITNLRAKESIICLVDQLDCSIMNTGGSGEN